MTHWRQQAEYLKNKSKANPGNWRGSNLGMLFIGFLIFMPFGLVLLAILTLGKNINLLGMFKDFWRRMTKGAPFQQPNLWASADDNWQRQHSYTGNAAYNQYRSGREAEARAAEAKARAQMQAEEDAFHEYQTFKKTAEDKAMFERFKADQKSDD